MGLKWVVGGCVVEVNPYMKVRHVDGNEKQGQNLRLSKVNVNPLPFSIITKYGIRGDNLFNPKIVLNKF